MEDAQRAAHVARRLPETQGAHLYLWHLRFSLTESARQAAGFNAVSVYHHWGLSEGKAGTLDFDFYRSHTALYEVAKEVGLLVIARPGVSRHTVSVTISHSDMLRIRVAVHQRECG